MKTVKTTKKSLKKPVYVVDITTCETIDDVRLAFAKAKFDAGIALSEDNLRAIIEDAINDYTDFLADNIAAATCEALAFVNSIKEKKQPWYKRAWKKITGVFTR